MKNLAAEPSLEALKQQLNAEMEALLRKDEDPRMFGRGAVFEAYKYLGGPRPFLRRLAEEPPITRRDRRCPSR